MELACQILRQDMAAEQTSLSLRVDIEDKLDRVESLLPSDSRRRVRD